MLKIERLEGYILNPNDKVVNSIFKRIEKASGVCPCAHKEWDEETPLIDMICPCITYRTGNGCHCGLYIKSND